ncbi:MAG TPA: type I restriction enzyme HsdR N-terminal domain-containing protein [Bacteroidia bacterium]|nr:type I restriction enzyme HsdR N-terminal domain-containing protein [Bacteroidia bacterium]HNT79733.1 type I restriction enzyme HsdR N-terminal domain-containing protein [Bacteroidia bacterium]
MSNEPVPNLKINLPTYEYRVTKKLDSLYIFDPVRKKEVVLSPEEFVRQHVLNFLIHHKNVPISIIAVEKEMTLQNNAIKRADIIVYHQEVAWLVVECKAPYIPISAQALAQAGVYIRNVNAEITWLTNGLTHLLFHHPTQKYIQPDDLLYPSK